ncbi:hypothetical protein C8Q78DRAFT_556573 [Trametes maxima]|nr:hypothetical protein C8Q78DRAFT_556573 [Trametes maxima]
MSSYSGLTGAFSRSAPPPRSQALEAPTAPPRSFEVPAAPPGSFDVPTVPPTHHRSSRNEDPQTQTIPLIPSNRDDLPYGSLLGLAKYGRPEMVYNHADRVFEGTSLMRTVPSDDDRPTIVLEIAVSSTHGASHDSHSCIPLIFYGMQWPGYQKRRFREEIPLTDLPRSKPITRGELAIAVAHAYLNFMEKVRP